MHLYRPLFPKQFWLLRPLPSSHLGFLFIFMNIQEQPTRHPISNEMAKKFALGSAMQLLDSAIHLFGELCGERNVYNGAHSLVIKIVTTLFHHVVINLTIPTFYVIFLCFPVKTARRCAKSDEVNDGIEER